MVKSQTINNLDQKPLTADLIHFHIKFYMDISYMLIKHYFYYYYLILLALIFHQPCF